MTTSEPEPLAIGALGRVPAVWLVVGGILSVQFGAAIAKDLFHLVPPTAMVWMRLATSAVIFLVVVRPRVRGRTRVDWLVALAFGVSLVTMNWAIYQSFARIPLGVAVTIEFLGPLTVAVVGSRRPRDLVWVVLAGLGVALLGLTRSNLTVAGVLFALLAGAGWAAYILLSAKTGQHWSGISGLAVASLVGAVTLAGPAIAEAGSGLLQPRVLLLGVAVGLLSSVIPYSLELTALRRIPPRVFGILMSLEPAAAALAAMMLLSEFLTWTQWVALACVVAASVGATRSSRPQAEPIS
ncbi:EamA family transporter [Microlunatus panaciterrae]|uniref:Inner membrane transporter RhtA n=1 Tax=Microlunatus panaciterrae TaxID=400768 RepID=A0ABS2RI59_9ACTN|nr:inner membrane transporter RhtA [Microlunatus panaciterrae]